MAADTEVTNVEVPSSGHNNVEGPDENVGDKSKSNTEQTEEGKLEKVKTNTNENENGQELNTETEEATIIGADTEVIGGSGLQKHAERFHAKGAAAARTEDNRMTEATEAKNSEGLIKGTISGQTSNNHR